MGKAKTSTTKKRLKVSKLSKLIDFLDTDPVANSQFFSRDFSWLEFNKRVLEQTFDNSLPLLERVKFLSIYQSNLDEFFMKRVGLIRHQLLAGKTSPGRDGMTPAQTFLGIRNTVLELNKLAYQCYSEVLSPQLENIGIYTISWKETRTKEKEFLAKLFQERIFPILTPLAVDPGHPFPHISNLSTSLAVSLKAPGRDEPIFSRVKIPKSLASWVKLPPANASDTSERWISSMDIIINNLHSLFQKMEIINVLPFHITRTIESEQDDEGGADLLEMVEQELKQRRFSDTVKLTHLKKPDPWLLRFLMAELDLSEADLYEKPTLLDFTSLNVIADSPKPEHKFKHWTPLTSARLADENTNIFNIIAQKDILVHHPYESFTTSVERFVRTAATDPKVKAIKMTLYRTHEEGSVVKSLIQAAERGKEVVCLVELKARLDEERNISWANDMEDAGVHVVYGVVGLKTHCKLALVVREKADKLVSYAHIGTGNYHAITAKLYTDFGLMTSDKKITNEVIEVFNYLTGLSLKRDYKHLLVAPHNMKSKFLKLIQQEVENHNKGLPSGIIVKCNNLEDHDMVTALYAASQSGVKVDLSIRGICTLKPGIPGLSENIRVTAAVDRFLEHSRVFYFRAGVEDESDGRVYFGSADWMYRNLHGRVEVITPVNGIEAKARCLDLLKTMLDDQVQTWEMQSDGSYKRLSGTGISAQQKLMLATHKRIEQEMKDIL